MYVLHFNYTEDILGDQFLRPVDSCCALFFFFPSYFYNQWFICDPNNLSSMKFCCCLCSKQCGCEIRSSSVLLSGPPPAHVATRECECDGSDRHDAHVPAADDPEGAWHHH